MKKELKVFCLLSILTSSLYFIGCSSSDDELFIPSEINGKLTFQEFITSNKSSNKNSVIYTFKSDNYNQDLKVVSKIDNEILNSRIYLLNEISDWTEISSFSINIKNDVYKENINQLIIKKAKEIKNNFNYLEVRRIENIIDNLPKLLYENVEKEKFYHETLQAIFFHLAIFKSAKRSYEANSNDCECNVYDSFLNNDSPFYCSEDKLVSADETYSYLRNKLKDKTFAGKKFYARRTFAYLQQNSGNMLSVSKIDNILKQEFLRFWNNQITEIERSKIISSYSFESKNDEPVIEGPLDPYCLVHGVSQGSDCGCCSNYSGPCLWCSLGCYLHDASCTECDWWCGPACVAGPC